MQAGAITPKRIRALRRAMGWTASELARRLFITRSYVKSLEGGSLPISERIADRIAVLERDVYATLAQEKLIESRYPLPKKIKILAKPKKCAVCREWFIFPHPKQTVCTSATCKSEHARKMRQARAKHTPRAKHNANTSKKKITRASTRASTRGNKRPGARGIQNTRATIRTRNTPTRSSTRPGARK